MTHHKPMYRVFLGAPTRAFLLSEQSEHATYEWRTVSSSTTPQALGAPNVDGNASVLISTHEYEAASVRISEFYQNTIFHDDEPLGDGDYADQTTVFTWPPTPLEGDSELINKSRVDTTTVPSFLLPHDDSVDQIEPPPQETQPTFDSPSVSQSFSHSYSRSNLDMSRSIAHFPSFHFNPNVLSSLSLLAKAPKRVALLVAVLETDGPDMVTIKNGPDSGKEVAVLRMIVGDEEGRVAKMTAWRDVAEKWGGVAEDGTPGVKRGDVVLIENVNGTKDAETSPALTASPYLGSKLTICYRTLPRENTDQRLRPDLRLGASDASVRKVADVVRWFETMAGL